MHDSAAYEQLRDLLGQPSARRRAMARSALTVMCPDDALVKGENLGEQFHYHVLNTPAEWPMVHVTRKPRRRSRPLRARPALPHAAFGQRGQGDHGHEHNEGEISVSKFAPHEADQKRVVSTRVDDVIRAIVELGGTYPDVVQAVQEAKAGGCLEGRFEIDALPEAGRSYEATLETTARTPRPLKDQKRRITKYDVATN